MDFTAYPHLALDRVPLGDFEQFAVTQLEQLPVTTLAVCPDIFGTRTPDLICIALTQHYGADAPVRIGSPLGCRYWQPTFAATGFTAELMPTHRHSPFWLPSQTHACAAVVYDMRDTPGRATTIATAIRRLFVAYGRTPFVLLSDNPDALMHVFVPVQPAP